MREYERSLGQLNDAQRLAVATTDGPVLVIAGPGTGKTQLLTTRIAHILATTDTLPQNILCLTFTESAALTMRQRLVNMIGQGAYSVTISTYHAFGSELIRRFPDHFPEAIDMNPADDLTIDAIFREIVDGLPFSSPLKFSSMYLGDVKTLVSDAKRALLTPGDLHAVAAHNEAWLDKAQPIVAETLQDFTRLSKSSVPLFEKLLKRLAETAGTTQPHESVLPLSTLLLQELREALEQAAETGKTPPLREWKDKWLARDSEGRFVVAGQRTNHKIHAAADIYAQYLKALETRKLFDYDDMILRAVHTLEQNADLRYTLQEQYLYILLDEFQDTNGAQLRLVELLTDNPASEGKPNVLAVGDDDQAIYAFQGANYSHMLQFQRNYRDVLVVPLTENYRSHPDILHTARGIAEQIEERLHHHFPQIEKELTPAKDWSTFTDSSHASEARIGAPARSGRSRINDTVSEHRSREAETGSPRKSSEANFVGWGSDPETRQAGLASPGLVDERCVVRVERREAKSDVAQFAWAAKRIKRLVENGLNPSEIAVLAPKHKHLEPLIPFLKQETIPVRYEKRENVLDDPAINQLLRMSELVLALATGQHASANALWAQVLSFAFWQLPTSRIWQLSWQANDNQENWTDILLANDQLKPVVLFFLRLSMLAGAETLETMMDYLIGSQPLDLQEPGYDEFTSPFYECYFGDTAKALALQRHSREGGNPVSREPISDWIPGQAGNDEDEVNGLHPSFWSLLTSLTILRSRLRNYRAFDDGEPLQLQDFIEFVEAHRAADIKILNTSPYQEADDAVQLMTAYKAKGQEWGAVFVLNTSDEAWGSRARTASAHIGLPPNLQFIRYAGATEDERLRLFYVALTRAKTQLYLANYTADYAGKTTSRLKYLNETTDETGDIRSPLLPMSAQTVLPADDGVATPTTELAAYWQQRHTHALSHNELHALLQERLERFQLSPTHVNTFLDLEKQGPEFFLMNVLLRFPRAPSAPGEYGNAMHASIEWIHRYNKQHGHIPDTKLTLRTFEQHLRAMQLSQQSIAQLLERGSAALTAYLAQRAHTIHPNNEVEFNFRGEGVFIGDAHLGGKTDKLIVDKTSKTIQIVDFKTGKSHKRWTRDAKLHRYRRQLYLYKALIEGSHTFRGYQVTGAYLEFVEPDETGQINELHLTFDDTEEQRTRQLAQAIWDRVKNLNFPDANQYTPNTQGIEDFEQALLQS